MTPSTWRKRRSGSPLHRFEVLVNVIAAPEAEAALLRLLAMVAADADELWLMNDWQTPEDEGAFQSALGEQRVELGQTVELTRSRSKDFAALALRSRHAEVVREGQIVASADDFGETVHVKLSDHLALAALSL